MVAGQRVGVAVVDVARVAAEQRAGAAGGVGAVDRVEVRRARVGPLGAQLGGGGEQPGIGDRLGAVDRGRRDVDVRVVGGPVVRRHRQHRAVVLPVPVPVELAGQPRHRGGQPAGHRDPGAVSGDRLEAAQLHRPGEERVAVLLFPQVVRLALIGACQELQVGADQAGRRRLDGGVELAVHRQQGERLQRRAVGLVGPRALRAVDVEGGPVEVALRLLAGLREPHVVVQRLVVRQHPAGVGGRQLARHDRGVARPVVDVILSDVRGGVLPGRRGEHAAGARDDPRVHRVVEDQAVRGDVPEHQPEHVPGRRRQVRPGDVDMAVLEHTGSLSGNAGGICCWVFQTAGNQDAEGDP